MLLRKNAFLVVGFEVYPAVHKPTAVVPGKSGGQALVVRGEKKTRLDQYLKSRCRSQELTSLTNGIPQAHRRVGIAFDWLGFCRLRCRPRS